MIELPFDLLDLLFVSLRERCLQIPAYDLTAITRHIMHEEIAYVRKDIKQPEG